MLFTLSCANHAKRVYYQYKGITITRIDKDAESDFYFGHIADEEKPPESYLKVTYPGIDGSMDGYLIFQKDSVSVISLTGYYNYSGAETPLKPNSRMDNGKFSRWEEEIEGKYANVCRISNDFDEQKKMNEENKSDVVITMQ